MVGKGKLVGGLEHEFHDFPYIGKNNPNISQLTFIFFRGVGQPPTRKVLGINPRNLIKGKLDWILDKILIKIR